MNNNLARLHEISQKKERLIIGLMSGTSLDGLDVALCRIKNSGLQTSFELLEFETIPYQKAFADDIRSVFSKRQVDLQKVCLLNEVAGSLHAELILDCLTRWNIKPSEVDCIASHGQTIYHAPKRLHKLENYPNATLQIGDGDHIARKTGIITLSDFRQKHIASGGEGAPLALYGDYILFTSQKENRLLLNIGGIANFTFLPEDGDPDNILCTDTGPGNTLIDNLVQKYFDQPYDKDGLIAAKNAVNNSLFAAMMEHEFFSQELPKTIGPELFNAEFIERAKQKAGISEISPGDLVATISKLTAYTILKGLEKYRDVKLAIYASGGGARNPTVMNYLGAELPNATISSTEDLGVNPDAKEAILFAILANETLSDSDLKIGNQPAATMGKISLPY